MELMKKIMLSGMMLAGMLLLTSCNSCVNVDNIRFRVNDEKTVTDERILKGFEEIEITGSPTVIYTQGDKFSVRVTGSERLVDNTITEVEGRALTVRNKGKVGIVNISFGDEDDLKVYVTSPDLTAIRLNGSGDFISDQRIDTDKMNVVLRGSGDINIRDLICDDCTTEVVGSGDLVISRLESRSHEISLIGSGDIKVKQWNVDNSDISLRGSGDIKVDFVEGCKSADCELIGSGDVMMSGVLGHYNCQKRGSGDIHIDNLSVEK